MKLSVILTGATGMVGEGVLHECLLHHNVERVLVINRKPCGVAHPKLTEIVHSDFFDLSAYAAQLTGYNACFFCLGVSSLGMSEAEYSKVTHDLTLSVAALLSDLNPEMVFCYVTAGGTDSTEQGKSMWARVKGRTENDLLKLPFKAAHMFRPGYIHPIKGLNNAHRYYAAFMWLYPVLRRIIPKHAVSLSELGRAMINIASSNSPSSILNCEDMVRTAKT
ncbi:epimerase [Paenibacillaceae bacterium]|nr:epimerase [Paenibacillaceae bacterium]